MRWLGVAVLGIGLCQAQVRTVGGGQWFPEEPAALTRVLNESLSTARKRAAGEPSRPGLAALIVPHAAIQYSGSIAAAGYRRIGEPPRNIILLAFSHRYALKGIVAPRVASYKTPLGEVAVNQAVVRELGFDRAEPKTIEDHSFDNQLPFIRRFAPEAQLVPLMVGSLDAADLKQAARKLAARMAKGDLVIASSDFTHYGQAYGYQPFGAKATKPAERLRDLANDAFEAVGSADVVLFDRHLVQTEDTICGRDPIRLLMTALAVWRKDVYIETADMMLSADLNNDFSLSVTYGALAFYPSASYTVSESGQKRLLQEAQAALESYYTGQRPAAAVSEDAELRYRTGAFVTVRKNGELRGCIGSLAPREPLSETVADRTIAAVKSDPRFSPLKREEGPVEVEISVLTPMKRIRSWQEYTPGMGGVIVTGSKGGLLLPQVAKEMNWTPVQFLEGLAQKAGLSKNAYKDREARLYVFNAQVFGER